MLISTSWTRQPQSVPRPAQYWIERGLIFAYHGATNRSVFVRNGITLGAANTIAGTAPGVSPLGAGRYYDGSSNQLWFTKGAAATDALEGVRTCTLVTTARCDSTATEGRALGFQGNNAQVLWNIETNASTLWRFQMRDDSSNILNLTGGTITVGKTETLVTSVNGLGGAAILYQGGAVYAGTAPAGTMSIGGVTLGYYLRTTTVLQRWTGWLGDQFIFNKVLTHAECKSLEKNPFQIWEPLSRQIWVGPSAASSLPTLSASTYKPGTLTATGWQPRVTAS